MNLPQQYAQASRATKFRPEGWPSQVLHAWAAETLQAAVSPVEATDLALCWTGWPNQRTPGPGEEFAGSWGDLCRYLAKMKALRCAHKDYAPMWGPVTYGPFTPEKGRHAGLPVDHYRNAESAQMVYCLVLDSDSGDDWVELLNVLDQLGLAYFAHRTPSHRDEGTAKWRVVLPLAHPLGDEDCRLRWPEMYSTARLAFAALGACWFDTTCRDLARGFFGPVAIGNAPAREVRAKPGRTLDLTKLVAPPAPPLSNDCIKYEGQAHGHEHGDWLLQTFDVVQWAKDAGLYLAQATEDRKHYLICPWRESHTGGKQGRTDTMVFSQPGPGLFCNHESCNGKTLRVLFGELSDGDKAKYCNRRLPKEVWQSQKLWGACSPVTADAEAVAWLRRNGLSPETIARLDIVRVLPAGGAELPWWACTKRDGRRVPWTETGHRLVLQAFEPAPNAAGRMQLFGLNAVNPRSGHMVASSPLGILATGSPPGLAEVDVVELIPGPAEWLSRFVAVADSQPSSRRVVWGACSGAPHPGLPGCIPKGTAVLIGTNWPSATSWCRQLAASGAKVFFRPLAGRATDLARSAIAEIQERSTEARTDVPKLTPELARHGLADTVGGRQLADAWQVCCREWGRAEQVPAAAAEVHKSKFDALDNWEQGEYRAAMRDWSKS